MAGFEIFKMMGTIALNKEDALRDIQVIKQSVEKSTKEMGNAFSKFTKDHSAQFKKVGMVSAAVGAAIILVAKKVRAAFNEYESALVDMGKITSESFGSIEDRMKKLPPVLGNLTELTRGYYQIVSAGVKEPKLAIDTLTVSAQTAAAAHMNQSEVVKGLTKVMAGYEGRIKTVSEAADLMFAIEKEGQTTVGELIPVVGGLATMASQLKISQDEMGASMAVISKTAANTAEAATELEGVFTGLMKPTETMSATIKKMGFETAELAIEELGFVEVLRLLDEATGGSSEKLGELFGRKQAILGVSKLTANGMITLADTITSVADKTGMADDAYKDWLTTGEALNKETKALTDNLWIMMGDAIDPMMDKIQERFVDVVAGVGDWIEKNAELAASILTWGTAIGFLLVPFGALMIMLPGLMIAMPHIIAGFGTLSVLLGGLPGFLILAAVGFTKLGIEIKKAWDEARSGPSWKELRDEAVHAADAQTAALDKLQKAYNLTNEELADYIKNQGFVVDKGAVALEKLRIAYHLSNEELDYWIENHELSETAIANHAKIMKELEVADYKFLHIQNQATKAVDEATKSFEDLDVAILNSMILGRELTEQQEDYMTLRQRMTDIDRTATQKKLDDLDREAIALMANMATNKLTYEQIEEYRKVMRDSIVKDSAEREEYLNDLAEAEKRLFELEHSEIEVKLQDLEDEKQARFQAAEQAMLSVAKLDEAFSISIALYEKEKDLVIESAIEKTKTVIAEIDKEIEARKKADESIVELAEKRLEEVKKLQDLYSKESESALAVSIAQSKEEISSLNQAIALRGKTKEAVEELIKKRNEEIANLALLKAAYSNAATSAQELAVAEKARVDTGPTGAAEAGQFKVLNAAGEYVGVTGDANTLTAAEIEEGWQLVPLEQMAKGGIVKTFIDAIRHLAAGGGIGTDTVPIMATPGEYVIDKPMTDFIRRTGMVTGGLVKAIQRGLPTPNPEFAGGGMVARWTRSSPDGGGELSFPSVANKSNGWIYSPTIHINNPVVRNDNDLVEMKSLMEEVLAENADVLDLSGNEIGG